jgi:hypothetical protein
MSFSIYTMSIQETTRYLYTSIANTPSIYIKSMLWIVDCGLWICGYAGLWTVNSREIQDSVYAVYGTCTNYR